MKIISFVILTIFLIFFKEINSKNGEKVLSRNRRVANGTQAQLGQFPYFASVSIFFNSTIRSFCGGTFIRYNFVLTVSSQETQIYYITL